MKRYDLAIFDLDGTILNTLQDLTDSLNHALIACSLPGRSEEEVRRFVGNGVPKLIERAVPAGSDEKRIQAVYKEFSSHYQKHCADRTAPYKGIPSLLSDLKAAGMRLAVVSNKDDDAVKQLCGFYFPNIFDLAVGGSETVRKKPAPDAVFSVLKELEVRPERTIYIGDSDVDFQTAKNAGIPSLIVSWGFRDSEYLFAHGCETLISDIETLKSKLLK